MSSRKLARERENKLFASEYEETTWSAQTWTTFAAQGGGGGGDRRERALHVPVAAVLGPIVAHRNFGRAAAAADGAEHGGVALGGGVEHGGVAAGAPFAAAFALNARTTRVSHNLILGAAAAPKGDHRSVFARDFGVAHSRQQYVNQDVFGMRVECLPFDANGW